MTAPAPALRVARLALRAPSRDDVLPFRNDLQDALRTASLPFLPGGARLHVRRLSLGRLPRGLSRQALAALLARRLGALPVVVLRWPDAAPEGAAAAVLPDRVTAAAFALRAAVSGTPPHWAVARQFPGVPWTVPSLAVTRILDAEAATAAVAIGRLPWLPGGAEVLLSALGEAPAPAIGRWLDALLPGMPEGGATRVASAIRETGAAPIMPAGGDPPPQRIASPAAASGSHAEGPLQRLAALAAARFGRDDPRAQLAVAWAAAPRGGPPSLTAARRLLWRLPPDPSRDTPGKPPGNGLVLPSLSGRTSHGEGPSHTAPPAIEAEPAATVAVRPAPLADLATQPDLAGLPSRMAGLWLLLPALRLIGAETAQDALGLPLCARLMRRFAARAGLDPDRLGLDPEGDEAFAEPAARWSAHPAVLSLLGGAHPLPLSRAGRGRALLGLKRGPPGLACLGPADLHPLRGAGVALARVRAPRPADPETALMLATQRLVIRLTGRGWRVLIRRRGRVRLSPTHLDVTYDGRDADIAVRQAGLDLDPGWVPWLGRVVSFHYDYSQVRDWGGTDGR